MLLLQLACTPSPLDTGESPAPVDTADTACGDVPVATALARLFVGEADACQVDWYLGQLDGIEADRAGPWQERLWRMYGDRSAMDVAGSTALRERAAVPEVVRADDGSVYLYFVEGDLDFAREVASTGSDWFKDHGLIGYGAINAIVSDDGLEFRALEDFGIGAIVPGFVADPDVIRLPDGRWRMYYVGQRVEELGPMTDPAPISANTVFYAESDDLVHWLQLGEAVSGVPADPSVVCLDATTCQLVATGLVWGDSSDGGVSFTPRTDPIIGGFAPEFVGDETELGLYFNSMEVGAALAFTTSSSRGANWSEPVEAVGPCLVEAPSFLGDPADGAWVYYHYYTGGRSGSDFGEHADDTAYPDPCDDVVDPRAEPE